MGGVLGPKFSKQGPFFGRFSLNPRQDSLLVSDGGSDIVWICKTLSSIPLDTLFGA